MTSVIFTQTASEKHDLKMKSILYLFFIINTSLFAQDTVRFSEEFVVPFDVFITYPDGEIINFGIEFSDLHQNYFIPNSEFESIPNFDKIFITAQTIQGVMLNDALVEHRSNHALKVIGDSVCLNLPCYIDYLFEIKTNRYWRKMNQGENLEFVKFRCEFTCVKLGSYEAKLVSPLARCKKRAYLEKLVDVYMITEITKIIPVDVEK